MVYSSTGYIEDFVSKLGPIRMTLDVRDREGGGRRVDLVWREEGVYKVTRRTWRRGRTSG